MAAEATLSVNIRAQDAASSVLKGIAGEIHNAGAAAEKGAGMLGKFGGGLHDVMKIAGGMVVGNALTGLTKGLGEQFKDVISGTTEFAGQVKQLGRVTGMAAEDASGLVAAMKEMGMEPEHAVGSFVKFAKGLQGVEDAEDGVMKGGKTTLAAINDLGIQINDAAGHALPFNNVLEQVSDRFHEMPDGMEKTARATQLFGKSGADLLPLLNLGKEGLKEMEASAKKYGLTLTAQNLDQVKQFTKSHKDLDMALEGVKLQIGLAVMPALGNMAKGLSNVVVEGLAFGKSLLANLQLGERFGPAFKVAGDVLNMLKNVLLALVKGDANSFFLAINQEIFNLTGSFDAFREQTLGLTAFLFGILPDAFNKVKEAIAPVVKAIVDFISANPEPVFAGLGAIILAAVVPGFVAWAAAAVTAAAATIIAMLPVILIMAAIGAVVALFALAWKNNWGDIQGKTQAVVGFLSGVPGMVGGFFNEIGTAVHGLVTGIGDRWHELTSNTTAAWNNIWQTISGLWNRITSTAKDALSMLTSTVGGAFDAIGTTIHDVIDNLTGAWSSFTGFLGTTWGNAWNGIHDALASVVTRIVGGLDAMISAWNGIRFTFPGVTIFGGTPAQTTLGSFSFGVPSIPTIPMPSFDQGGVMPGAAGVPGLAVLHGGEVVASPGGGVLKDAFKAALLEVFGTGNVEIKVDGMVMARATRDNLLRLQKGMTTLGFV